MRDVSLRERVGGRWAVSWQGWLVALPPLAAVTLAAEPSLLTSPQWWVLTVAGWLGAGAVMALGSVTVFRSRAVRPLPVVAVIGLGAVAGAARAAVLVAGAQAWHVPVEASAPSRLAVGVVLGAFWMPGVAAFLFRRDCLAQQWKVLVADMGTVGDRLVASSSARQRWARTLLERACAEVDYRERPSSAQELAQLRVKVRAVSHALYVPVPDIPKLSLRAQVCAVAVAGGLRPRWVLVEVALTGVWFLHPTAGWWMAAVETVTFVVLLAGAAAAVNWCTGRGWPALVAVPTTCAILLTPVVALGVPLVMFGQPYAWAPILSAAMFAVLVVPATSAKLANSPEEALAALQSRSAALAAQAWALEAAEAEECRRLARHLHGTVAAELFAGELLLGLGVPPRREGRNRLTSLLAGPPPVRVPDCVTVRLAKLAAGWAPAVRVAVDISDDVSFDDWTPAGADGLVDVAAELVANAVRHGGATNVSVSVQACPDGATVLVCDDGRGLPEQGATSTGLGAALLAEVCQSTHVSSGPGGGVQVAAQLAAIR